MLVAVETHAAEQVLRALCLDSAFHLQQLVVCALKAVGLDETVDVLFVCAVGDGRTKRMQVVLVSLEELVGQHAAADGRLLRVDDTVAIEVETLGESVIVMAHVSVIVLCVCVCMTGMLLRVDWIACNSYSSSDDKR